MTTRDQVTAQERSQPDPGRDLAWTWAWLAISAMVWLVAFAAAEGLYALLGYTEGVGGEPFWVDLLMGVVLWLPFAAVLGFCLNTGVRAVRGGLRSAWIPMAVACAALAGMMILIVAQIVDALL